MIAKDRFVSVFGIVSPGDLSLTKNILRGAVDAGFAMVLSHPGTKKPMCTLTARDSKKADLEAQRLAREAGNANWERVRHPCGLKHAISDRKEADRIITRLERDGAAANVGVELGASRMIVVDVDTAAEMEGFVSDWKAATGSEVPRPTVLSPGAYRDGEWVHSDGGHFWFELPDGLELPAGSGILKAESGWVAIWADHQVLVPPSLRAEGPYRLIGQVSEAPAWLTDRIMMEALAREERWRANADRVAQRSGETSEIDVWAAEALWSDILLSDGWVDTGLVDNCSCPVWTAPGGHSSPKSATAHDLGCTRYDSSDGHAPLHVWTDNPPEFLADCIRDRNTRTITKLTYLAYRDHAGNLGAATRGLGIRSTGSESAFPAFAYESGSPVRVQESIMSASTSDQTDVDNTGQETTPEDEVLDPVERLRRFVLGADELDSIPDPEPLIKGMLDLDTLGWIIGKSGHGKSFFTLDMAAHIAAGIPKWHGMDVTDGPVLYVVAEGVRGFKKRVRAWEQHHGVTLGKRLQIVRVPVRIMSDVEWGALRYLVREEIRPRLVVLDTLARVSIGAEENSNSDMSILVDRADRMVRETGACVMFVHHTGHAGENGRGASAMIGAMNTEIKVTKKDKGVLEITNTKQKDDEELPPLVLHLQQVPLPDGRNSAVLVNPAGSTDPFENAKPERKPWERMLYLLHSNSASYGMSKAEMISLYRERCSLEQTPFTRATAYRAFERLYDEGLVIRVTDDKTDKLVERFITAPGVETDNLGW